MKTMNLAIIVIALFTSSCAVIFGGSKYNAYIDTNDPQAEIYVDGEKVGTGNVQTLYPRKNNIEITLKKEECEEQRRVYPNQVRVGSEVLSFLAWNFVGLIVDFGTGAAYRPDIDTRGVEKLTDKNYKYNIDYTGCDDIP